MLRDKTFANLRTSAKGLIGVRLMRCSVNSFAKKGASEQPFVPMPFNIPMEGMLGCKPTNGLRSTLAGLSAAQ